MALPDLIVPRQQVQISDGKDIVKLDVSVDEQHTGESDVTEYPVEEGANVSDNSRPKPRTFTIHGLVTSAPLNGLEPYKIAPGLKELRGKAAWAKLDKWRRSGTRVSVLTTFYGYIDVVLTSITVPRNVRNSDGAELILAFRQVFTTTTRSVPKPTRDTKQQTQKLGKKPAAAPDTSLDDSGKTVLLSVEEAIEARLAPP